MTENNRKNGRFFMETPRHPKIAAPREAATEIFHVARLIPHVAASRPRSKEASHIPIVCSPWTRWWRAQWR
jgi:hypothetical protein